MENENSIIKSREIKRKLQKKYHFNPFIMNECPKCCRNIWDRISYQVAKKEIITSCPYCHRSFVS